MTREELRHRIGLTAFGTQSETDELVDEIIEEQQLQKRHYVRLRVEAAKQDIFKYMDSLTQQEFDDKSTTDWIELFCKQILELE